MRVETTKKMQDKYRRRFRYFEMQKKRENGSVITYAERIPRMWWRPFLWIGNRLEKLNYSLEPKHPVQNEHGVFNKHMVGGGSTGYWKRHWLIRKYFVLTA